MKVFVEFRILGEFGIESVDIFERLQIVEMKLRVTIRYRFLETQVEYQPYFGLL